MGSKGLRPSREFMPLALLRSTIGSLQGGFPMQFNSLRWNLMAVNVAPAVGQGVICCFSTCFLMQRCSMEAL